MVGIDAHGYKRVNYSELPYLALAAIRELKTENDSLRAQLASVQERLTRLEKTQPRKPRKKPSTFARSRGTPVAVERRP